MTKIRKSKQYLVLEGFGHAQRRRLRRVLNIGICDLSVIWCLEFVILNTKLEGKAYTSVLAQGPGFQCNTTSG